MFRLIYFDVTGSHPFHYAMMRSRAVLGLLLLILVAGGVLPRPGGASPAADLLSLLKAYPEFLDRIDGNELVWRDGTRMQIDDGIAAKTFGAKLDRPDIKDMFSMRYPLGEQGVPPKVDFDPGRIRYEALFRKMYGDCKASGFMRNMVDVTWLPHKDGKVVKFNKVNGAAAALQKVSSELDDLPDRFLTYLRPTQGTYNCRDIAGTSRQSAHGLGIAIDIASAHSYYWRWARLDKEGRIPFRNETPWEIVRIFEKNGFIWGGKWYHYDTMHFEYRPEIIAASN